MTAMPSARAPALDFGALISMFTIGVTAFLTVVDLFATQAILPSLAERYGVSPSAMGVAVNASTFGMAASGLAVALFSARINRRLGITAALIALSIPTLLLAHAPDLATFAALRVAQGVLMAAAFALTLAHLGERCSGRAAAGAFAAYITGNVASNLFGRLLAAGLVDTLGVTANFYVFAALNAAGALLVFFTIHKARRMGAVMAPPSPWSAFAAHLRNPALCIAFAIGFLILFAFIGVFTYVNFVLVRAPLSLPMMALGLVYFVFLPSIFTTPLAAQFARIGGSRAAMWLGLGLAMVGMPLLLSPSLPPLLAGMALVAIGTFFAQATATAFVSQAAEADRGAASGLYLASYFLGGLAGSAILGALFDRFGWAAAVAGVGVALALAALLAIRLCVTRADGAAASS